MYFFTRRDIYLQNVIDYGADPTGSADSTSAIQAAVDWTSGANRGTIYFPLGTYKVTAPITFNYDGNLSIRFLGEPGSTVTGAFSGFIFDRHLAIPNNTTGGRVFEKLSVTNGHATGGCLRLGSTMGGAIRDCGFSGYINVTTEDAVGQSSQSIYIEDCAAAWNGVGSATGSHNIIIGGGGSIQGCNIGSADVGVRAYGSGLHISGGRAERANTSYLFGLDSGGNNVGMSGFSIVSATTEGSWTSYDLAGLCQGFLIAGVGSFAHASDNSGVVPNIQGGQYGIRIRADCARAGVIHSCQLGGPYEQAALAVENATARGNVVIRENNAVNTGGSGSSLSFPGNAYTARFYNNNIDPLWTFSQLPTGGNVLEGDEFDITNSNTATWGATVGGGGSNRVRVRYNGTNWTVVGK